MDRQTVIADAIAQLEAVGSSEVGRHIGVAINKTVLRACDQMRQAMRDTLGRNVTGPDSLYGARSISDYTANAVNATQTDFKDADAVSASVYVNARQGVRTKDQSATLKYLFGTGPNERRAGDVGMSNDQIDIPRTEALVLTRHMTGITPGGRQRKGLLALLNANAKRHSKRTPHEVAQQMAWGARDDCAAREAQGLTPERLASQLAHHRETYGADDLRRRLDAARRAGQTAATAINAHAKRRELSGATDWGVYKGADRVSGLPAFFARPIRIRNPSGGYHTFRRRDGSVGRMPDMLTVAPEYGASGKGAGPRALTTARAETRYQPILQEPWDAMGDAGAEMLAEECAREYAHALERRDQGRSF